MRTTALGVPVDDLLVCRNCDAVWLRPQLKVGERARCSRCHSVILTNKVRASDRTLALMVASLILFLIAVSFPFMAMERSGLSNQISVIDAVLALWSNDMPLLGAASALFVLVFPLIRMLLLIHVFGALRLRRRLGPLAARSLRLAQDLDPWAMVEIFMIGVIVSLVKVGDLARISVGPAFWALTALIVVLTMTTAMWCRDTAWDDMRARS